MGSGASVATQVTHCLYLCALIRNNYVSLAGIIPLLKFCDKTAINGKAKVSEIYMEFQANTVIMHVSYAKMEPTCQVAL